MSFSYDVSVIIPAFNQEKYIKATIESAIAQNFKGSYEILISDDCSKDKTWEIIKSYSQRDDVKINRFEKNTGYVGSYNWLIEQSSGKYIAHLDGDDLFYPDKLQLSYDVLESDPNCSLVFHRVDVEMPDGELYTGLRSERVDSLKYEKDFFIRNVTPFVNSSKVFRSVNAIKLKGDLNSWQVYDYWLHLTHIADGYARVCSKKELGLYRRLGGTAGRAYERKLVFVYDHLASQSRQYNGDINASIGLSMLRKFLKLRPISLVEIRLFFSTLPSLKIAKYWDIIFWMYNGKLKKK